MEKHTHHYQYFAEQLQMKRQMNKVTSICYYHLRRLFQLRGCVRQNVMLHLVTSLIYTDTHRQL